MDINKWMMLGGNPYFRKAPDVKRDFRRVLRCPWIQHLSSPQNSWRCTSAHRPPDDLGSQLVIWAKICQDDIR